VTIPWLQLGPFSSGGALDLFSLCSLMLLHSFFVFFFVTDTFPGFGFRIESACNPSASPGWTPHCFWNQLLEMVFCLPFTLFLFRLASLHYLSFVCDDLLSLIMTFPKLFFLICMLSTTFLACVSPSARDVSLQDFWL